MKKVYLIRHALPAFPGGSKMCIGITDIPLGSAGLEQARQMAKRLPPVTGVYSSPLRRALQTAGAIDAHVTVLPGLRELYAGEWDGLTFDQIKRKYPELYAARGRDRTLPLPGEERAEAGLLRFRDAMQTAAVRSEGDFAVVAHGGIIARFLQEISGTWYKPDYAEIISLTYNNGIFTLQEE